MKILRSEKGQAIPEKSINITSEAFAQIGQTEVYWLGSAGILINSRGTVIMIDPVLIGFDMPLLIDSPIMPEEVERLDGVLITHIDNDHMSRPTLNAIKDVTPEIHAPKYVASVLKDEEGLNATGYDIGDEFEIGNIKIKLTPARHNWQNESSKWAYREWKEEDYCGFWLETPDGKIWLPGDSQLLDSHLEMEEADMIIFDFSDNVWHITFDGAIKLANTYPKSDLLCIHWGSVDAPDMNAFNGNPEDLVEEVVNPERIYAIPAGEKYILTRK